MQRRGWIEVSREWIEGRLRVKSGVKLVAVQRDFGGEYDNFRVFFSGGDLPEVEELELSSRVDDARVIEE